MTETEGVRSMLTADQVLQRIPVSRTTLFRMERDGVFPQGQPIAPHRKLWFEDEVVAWQKQLQDPESALSKAIHSRAKSAQPKRKKVGGSVTVFSASKPSG